jgi:hypothetical protein
VDYRVNSRDFLRQARKAAAKRHLGLKTKTLDEDTVVLMSFEKEFEPSKTRGKKDNLYGAFIDYCHLNSKSLISATKLAEQMGISWIRANEMMDAGREEGFIGEELVSIGGKRRGFEVFLSPESKSVPEVSEPQQSEEKLKPIENNSMTVTRSQIADVNGGVYVQ